MPIVSTTFSLRAQAYPAPTFQWYIGDEEDPEERTPLTNDGLYSGVTTRVLTITDVTADLNGNNYSCKVSNSAGDTWSDLAILTVQSALTITEQPQDQHPGTGEPLFMFLDAEGAGPITYQWYHDDVLMVGETNYYYYKEEAEESDEGEYYCIVSNDTESVQSDTIDVLVGTDPVEFSAPLFDRDDFNVSSASDGEVDFTNPSVVGFVGTVDSEYIYRTVNNISQFHAVIEYTTGPEYVDTFNFEYYRIQGCGLATGSPPWFTDDIAGVTFFAHDDDGLNQNRFRMVDQNNNIIWSSPSLYDANTSYFCRVTFDVTEIGVGSSYDLTIRLEVPSLSIDNTETIIGWTGFGTSTAKMVVFGPFYTDHVAQMHCVSYYTLEAGG